MKTIQKRAVGEIVVKKSRFIATLQPVENKEEAESFIAEMKKKYWDARHNCSAYILPAAGGQTPVLHSSDDGEPSGTAGKPMLSVLEGRQLSGVAVVVTRYFGGVLLGTGGLVRAYQDAVTEGIGQAQLLEEKKMNRVRLETDYTLWGKVQSYAAAKESVIQEDVGYGEKVSACLLVEEGETDRIIKEIVELTGGKVHPEVGGSITRRVPVIENS